MAFTATAEWITRESEKYRLLPVSIREDWSRGEWSGYTWWEEAIYIRRPGIPEEKRVMWNPTMTEYSASVTFPIVLNELGDDGWELVSEVVYSSTIVPSQGHDRTGRPISVLFTLKRPRSA